MWDTFIKTKYYFSIFTLKYDEICIVIRIKYRDTYRIVDQERYIAVHIYSAVLPVIRLSILHVWVSSVTMSIWLMCTIMYQWTCHKLAIYGK